MKSVLKRIQEFNSERHPGLVDLKYSALLENPFRFFRGTAHLFYEDIPNNSFMLLSPRVWICGDLHLENFGSFRGLHRLYFDMNDFDEAMLAPCLFDIVRFCTSIFLIGHSVKYSKAKCKELIKAFLLSYSNMLIKGDAEFLEHNTALGFLKEFLDRVNLRNQKVLLAKKIKVTPNGVKIKCDKLKIHKAPKETRKRVKAAITEWMDQNGIMPDSFKVKDIAIRANGTSSIGLERYLILVNLKDAGGYCLLDMKEAITPSAYKYWKFKQPKWNNNAHRVISIQKRVQAGEPVFLSEISFENKSYVIREIQPEEDKVNFQLMLTDDAKFVALAHDMGSIVAWNSLRCGGRQGSAIADDMIRFGKYLPKHEEAILDYAEKYALTTVKYWQEFKRDYMQL